MAKARKHLTIADLNKSLPKEVAEKYEIVNLQKRTSTRFVHSVHGEVDLRTLSLARAKQLVQRKAPFIQVKKSKDKPA